MVQKNLPKIILGIFLTASLGFIFAGNAKADDFDNVSGWAWSETIGWISFNCNNPEITAPRCVAPNNYGVHICINEIDPICSAVLAPKTGKFTGYAWSENIGWISFKPADLAGCPIAPCEAKVDASGVVFGWARALANGGGWEGWISLRNDAKSYGVSIDTVSGDFSDFAWSDIVVGWISFNCLNQGVCSTSDYKVITSFSSNPPPTANNLLIDDFANTACGQISYPRTRFKWTFSDPNGDNQNDYRVQITSDSDHTFSSPIFDTYKITNSSWESLVDSGSLSWNSTYHWRLKVWDDGDPAAESSWIYPPSPLGSPTAQPGNYFTTPLHPYPLADFIISTQNPSIEEVVTATSTSRAFGTGVPIKSCLFEINPSGAGTFASNPNSCNVKITFSTAGVSVLKLTVTDSSNYSCYTTKTIKTRLPLPEWIEVPPVSFIGKLLAAILNFLRF